MGTDGPLIVSIRDQGVEVKVIPQLNSKTFFPALILLYKIIRKEKPDLIHTHSAIASFIGRIAGMLARTKTLYTVHGWHFVPNSVLQRRLFGLMLEVIVRPFTSAWISVSDYDLDLGLRTGVIAEKRAWVIPNGVEYHDNKSNYEESNVLRLVFVGRASFQKNCLEALFILKRCSKHVLLTMYVTSGDHLNSIKQAINDNGLEQRVTLIVDSAYVTQDLNLFDVMLLTSRYEGMPFCLLEAMRAGLPIIAADVCGLNEVVDHGRTGYLYTLYNFDEAVGYIAELDDVKVRRQLGNQAHLRFKQSFQSKQMASKTAEVYEILLEDDFVEKMKD